MHINSNVTCVMVSEVVLVHLFCRWSRGTMFMQAARLGRWMFGERAYSHQTRFVEVSARGDLPCHSTATDSYVVDSLE